MLTADDKISEVEMICWPDEPMFRRLNTYAGHPFGIAKGDIVMLRPWNPTVSENVRKSAKLWFTLNEAMHVAFTAIAPEYGVLVEGVLRETIESHDSEWFMRQGYRLGHDLGSSAVDTLLELWHLNWELAERDLFGEAFADDRKMARFAVMAWWYVRPWYGSLEDLEQFLEGFQAGLKSDTNAQRRIHNKLHRTSLGAAHFKILPRTHARDGEVCDE